ncbi:MAG TPA: ribonuclease HII [Candidatus Nanoarchaeia archaeon]|nr:ribonuclease HII [Candidatus Nanoarchaeia archaeon]
MRTLGIDDAGRGPVIGPMILAGALLQKPVEDQLKKLGVADSKTLTHPRRIALAKLIKESADAHHITITQPKDIDAALNGKINLNTLEAMKTADIINALNPEKEPLKVIVDCPSVNTQAWKKTLISFIKHPENLDISCEHKADANHVSVSAASILAKVTREEEVEKLKREYGEIGSGYPSDPYTQVFLKKNGKELRDKNLFRTSWATYKALFPEAKQALLGSF